jgi:hypothetical protein
MKTMLRSHAFRRAIWAVPLLAGLLASCGGGGGVRGGDGGRGAVGWGARAVKGAESVELALIEASNQDGAVAVCGGAVLAAEVDAAKAVGEVLDTKLVCQLAGQSESFCGCLQSELGPKLKAEHIDAVTAIVKTSIDGSIQSAVQTATSLDPKTRNGLVSCAAKAAISDAISGQ